MQLASFVRSVCVLVACGCVATPSAPSATSAVQTTPPDPREERRRKEGCERVARTP